MENDLNGGTKKYFFDNNDFSEEALRRKREEARKPSFSSEQVEAARKAGYEEGKKAGIAETIDSQEAKIRDLLQQVVMAATRLEQDETARLATFIDQSALVTAQALVRIIPTLLDETSLDQISGFMKTVLTETSKKQPLVLHVPSVHHAELCDRYEKMASDMRRTGKCEIVADPALTATECRFEWAGGGAEWSPENVAGLLMARIREILPENMKDAVNSSAQGVDESGNSPHNDETSNGDMP